MTDNIVLYAQWAPLGRLFYGNSADLKDRVTCQVIDAQHRVSIFLEIKSWTYYPGDAHSHSIYYAIYQGGRLLSVVSSNGTQTFNGLEYQVSAYYPAGFKSGFMQGYYY